MQKKRQIKRDGSNHLFIFLIKDQKYKTRACLETFSILIQFSFSKDSLWLSLWAWGGDISEYGLSVGIDLKIFTSLLNNLFFFHILFFPLLFFFFLCLRFPFDLFLMFIPEDQMVYFPKLNKLYSYTAGKFLETSKYYVWCFALSLQPCWYLLGFLQLERVLRAFWGMGGRSPSPSTGPKPVGGTVAEASYPEPSQGPLTPQWLHQQCPRDASIRGRQGQSHKLETIHTSNQRQPPRADLTQDTLISWNEQGSNNCWRAFLLFFLLCWVGHASIKGKDKNLC